MDGNGSTEHPIQGVLLACFFSSRWGFFIGDSEYIADCQTDASIPRQRLIDRELWEQVQAKLAKGSEEYGRRKKHDLEILAHPYFHCYKCGHIMTLVQGSKTDSKNKRHNVYMCGRRRRWGITGKDGHVGCDVPSVKVAEFDKLVARYFVGYLSDDAFVDAKFDEQANEDRTAGIQAEIVRHKNTITRLERGLRGLADVIFAALSDGLDTTNLQVRQREATGELRIAQNALSTAQAKLSEKPKLDKATARRGIFFDLARFEFKPITEQRQIMAKYVTRITHRIGQPTELQKRILANVKEAVFVDAEGKRHRSLPVEWITKQDRLVPEFSFRITAPVIETEPIEPEPTHGRMSHRISISSRINSAIRSSAW